MFTYNRLDHTRQTIEALQRNVYAKDSRLFIFSDAPKNEQATDSVQNVRDYLQTVDGFKEIQIIERTENWGLARNIIDGVTDVVDRYGKIIVLEDDIVTSEWFLKYMNDSLEIYKEKSEAMCVSGYAFATDNSKLPEVYFLHWNACWGWGTWKRAWKYFERAPKRMREEITAQEIYRINMDGSMPFFWQQFLDNCDGKIYTWAIFWHIAVMLRNGFTLFPRISLTNNIGMDGTGEHCVATSIYTRSLGTDPVRKFPKEISESIEGKKSTKKCYKVLTFPYSADACKKLGKSCRSSEQIRELFKYLNETVYLYCD